jgi:hypothetical protein
VLHVAEATVRDWVSRGRQVAGRTYKLQTLRSPRGRIAPGALWSFLAAVNGCEVSVGSERRAT